jgi:hypothetical protein
LSTKVTRTGALAKPRAVLSPPESATYDYYVGILGLRLQEEPPAIAILAAEIYAQRSSSGYPHSQADLLLCPCCHLLHRLNRCSPRPRRLYARSYKSQREAMDKRLPPRQAPRRCTTVATADCLRKDRTTDRCFERALLISQP